jgi:hypothetical protein
MNNPGTYNLGDKVVTTALTGEVITEGVSAAAVAQSFIDNLDGMLAAYIVCGFAYGSGGSSCIVTVQNSLDGVNWRDVARFDFATASARKSCNLSGLTPKGITTHSALGSESVNDGELGDMWRAVVTSTGTYGSSTTVSVRLGAR